MKKRKIIGTKERPRISVFRSLRGITAQIIDDQEGKTLAAASTVEKGLAKGGNIAAAKIIGKKLAERALAAGVKKAVFDRGTALYHGRVKALAEAAREGGLEF
ncbi:MAG: 50S ribosomal protein L18 [bacterium]